MNLCRTVSEICIVANVIIVCLIITYTYFELFANNNPVNYSVSKICRLSKLSLTKAFILNLIIYLPRMVGEITLFYTSTTASHSMIDPAEGVFFQSRRLTRRTTSLSSLRLACH